MKANAAATNTAAAAVSLMIFIFSFFCGEMKSQIFSREVFTNSSVITSAEVSRTSTQSLALKDT